MTIAPDSHDYPAAIIAAGPAALSAWDEFTASGSFRASTRSLYRGAALRFLRWLEPQGIGLAQVTSHLVERFLDEKDLSYDSKVTYRTALRRFSDMLVACQVVPANPIARARAGGEEPAPVGGLPESEESDVRRFCDVLRARMKQLEDDYARHKAHEKHFAREAEQIALRTDEVRYWLEDDYARQKAHEKHFARETKEIALRMEEVRYWLKVAIRELHAEEGADTQPGSSALRASHEGEESSADSASTQAN